MRQRPILKSPLPLSTVLGGGHLGKRVEGLVHVRQVQKLWAQVVGAELAARTRPKWIKGTTLYIAVENGAWAQHLTLMAPEILKVIRARTGRTFSALKFTAQSGASTNEEKAPEPKAKKETQPDVDLPELLRRVKVRALALKAQREKSRP